MVMTDPIADMLTRIRNAISAKKAEVEVPSSNLKIAITKILKNEGFIDDFETIRDNKQGILKIKLRYINGEPMIRGIRKISKPGRRIFKNKRRIPIVMGELGISIVSTPKGVMNGDDCRKMGIGGEIICEVW
ncbi:MAG: 30S ribosomal protein S8 [bacterium]